MSQKLKSNDTAQLALWVSDDDPPNLIKEWKEIHAPKAFKDSAEACGVILGPISFHELKPGQDRAGTPPDSAQGINVRLIVAECDIVGLLPQPEAQSLFTYDLERADLENMRLATRRAYGLVLAADGKTLRELRDDECDKIINLIGPDAAAREAINVTRH